jgi:hypothetical protein
VVVGNQNAILFFFQSKTSRHSFFNTLFQQISHELKWILENS